MTLAFQPRSCRQRLTKEDCAAVAAIYASRSAFAKGNRTVYARARAQGWLDEVCEHMVRLIKPNGYWSKERCAAAAQAFASRGEFAHHERSAYTQAMRAGWLDEICAHMVRQSNVQERWIYVIRCRDAQTAYVGLTWNVTERVRGHRRSRKAVQRLLSAAHVIKIVAGPLSPSKAADVERAMIERMRKAGWTLLNQARGGALGGVRKKWTKERCANLASQCSTLSEFITKYPVAYGACRSRGWGDEILGHLARETLPAGHWTFERCAEAARQCSSRAEFRERFDVARQIAQRNGWTDEICAHMRIQKQRNGYWNYERCANIVETCATMKEFRERYAGGYDAAHRNGWLSSLSARQGTGVTP